MSGQAYKDTIFYCDNAKLHMVYDFPIFPNFKAVLEAGQKWGRGAHAPQKCNAYVSCGWDLQSRLESYWITKCNFVSPPNSPLASKLTWINKPVTCFSFTASLNPIGWSGQLQLFLGLESKLKIVRWRPLISDQIKVQKWGRNLPLLKTIWWVWTFYF